MKKLLFPLVVVGVALGIMFLWGDDVQEGLLGNSFSFNAVTNATTTVNITSWTRIATTTPDMGWYTVCDNANGAVSTANPVYLAFVATTTIPAKPYGIRLDSGDCYTMSQAQDNMYYGWIYAIASNTTTTLLQIYK